tara:strand:- start:1509 stop:1784 length:276 start_codon:yes stop_codon:yes gene_type:complete
MAFKMKTPFLKKMVKEAGTPEQRKLGKKAQSKLKKAKDNRSKPPQPPKPGTVKGLTQFQYDMKPITSVGNKQLGKVRGKVRDKIKNYFFTK